MSDTDPGNESAQPSASYQQQLQVASNLLIPEDIRYNCQCCGRCCTGWAVGMTEDDYAKVKDVEWGSLYPELAGQELFVHRQAEFDSGLSLYPHYTKATAGGECPFLIDNLCSIHSTLGEESKPALCKLFPYTFTVTPSGTYLGVVYSSMAAVRNLGELLSNQRSMLEDRWRKILNQPLSRLATTHVPQQLPASAAELLPVSESSIAGSSVAGSPIAQSSIAGSSVAGSPAIESPFAAYKVNLASGIGISWTEYLQIEQQLLNLLGSSEYKNIFDTLLAGSQIIAEAVKLKSAGQDVSTLASFKPGIEQWSNQPTSTFENLIVNLLCFRNFEFREIQKQSSSSWMSSSKSALSDTKILKAGFSSVFLGRLQLPRIGLVNVAKTSRGKVMPLSAEINTFLQRYFYLKLFSKTFCGPTLSGLSMTAGYNNMLGNYLSALIYAKAQALSRGDNVIAIADLYEAFFLIDKEVVALGQLPQERAAFFDFGLSSPHLFSRLAAQMSATIGRA